MSLDVYLTIPGSVRKAGSGIWIREYGQTRQISRDEWEEKFPGTEPVTLEDKPEDIIEDGEVYSSNITHNLNKMADAAGIYYACWRPEEIGVTKASQLIPLLREGLAKLVADPEHYKQFNSSNGWGMYEHFVPWVREYLAACEEYPDANVSVSR